MIPAIARHRNELATLCRRYHVRRLEQFGSAAAGDFNPESSDLDFLVMFEELDPPAYAEAYLGFYEALRYCSPDLLNWYQQPPSPTRISWKAYSGTGKRSMQLESKK
jgi:hypothetical protein